MSIDEREHGPPRRGEGRQAGAVRSAPSPETRLADAIAGNPDAVPRLAALHPVFRRLEDAEAREAMGALVTVGDAAVVAGVPLSRVVAAITGDESVVCPDAVSTPDSDPPPPWIEDFDDDDAVVIDVRPILAGGDDPFDSVMAVAEPVARGGRLVIDAPFNPLPLRRVLAKMGFESVARTLGEGHIRVRCLRTAAEVGAGSDDGGTVFGARVWPEGDALHIDVRGMVAPGPLTAILALIDGGDHAGTIVVHHEREPVYLFPELAERGWTADRIDGEPGEVRLMLRRRGG